MHVYGELIRAQAEIRSTDHTTLSATGLLWWNTTLKQLKIADGTSAINLLANNDKCIFGNSVTAAYNLRLHRGASSLLQLLTGNDTTVEGSLSTSLGQLSFRAENYDTGDIPSYGNAGRLVYDTAAQKLKYDTGVAWVSVEAGLSTNTKSYVLAENLAAGDLVYPIDAGTIKKVVMNGAEIGTIQVETVFPNNPTVFEVCYDPYHKKIVAIYKNTNLYAVVGTLTGTSLTWGTPVQITAATLSGEIACCFDEKYNQVIVAYNTTLSGLAFVAGTVSGTTISFSTALQAGEQGSSVALSYSAYHQRTLVTFVNATANGSSLLLSNNGSGLTKNTASTFTTLGGNNKAYVLYHKNDQVGFFGVKATTGGVTFHVGSLVASDGSMTAVDFSSAETGFFPNANECAVTYDAINNLPVFVTRSSADSKIYAYILSTIKTLDGARAGSNLTEIDFSSAASEHIHTAFDKNEERVLISYRDTASNSNKVITLDLHNSIPTFSSPVTIEAESATWSLATDLRIAPVEHESRLVTFFGHYDGVSTFDQRSAQIKIVTPKNCIGIIETLGSTGNSRTVDLFGSLCSLFTDKTPGKIAYIQDDITIGYNKTRYPIGQFISATELAIGRS